MPTTAQRARSTSDPACRPATHADTDDLFRTALEELKLHATIVDRDGRIVFANRYLTDRTGWTGEELIGQDVFDVFDAEETRPAKRASYHEAIVSEVSIPTWETEWLTRDREVLRIAWSSSFVRDTAGRIQGIASVGEDVTERRRLEAVQNRLVAAVEQAAEAIVVTDARGRIEYANPAFERSTGVPVTDAVGRRAWAVTPFAPAGADLRSIVRRLQTGEPWSGEWDVVRRDGSIYREEASVAAVRGADGTVDGFVSVSRDVTRIREIQDTLDTTILQRASVARALSRLTGRATPEDTAQGISDALVDIPGIEVATLLEFADEDIKVLAITALHGTRWQPGDVLTPAQAAALRRRSADGAWSQMAVQAGPETSDETSLDLSPGLLAVACAPWVTESGVGGMVIVGTGTAATAERMDAQTSTAMEFAAAARALLAGPLAERRALLQQRTEISRVLSTGAFRAVFQPVVDMANGRAIGYEALTRFDDGLAPDLRFADAGRCGLGIDLEAATLERAVADSMLLPAGPWIALNVSAAMILAGDRLTAVLRRRTRPVVLEVTEHDIIEDYEAVRLAVNHLGPDIRLAVDDAGSGVANFTHIVKLRPDFVKIDASLVRGVNTDLTRQALIVGLHHFARTTNGWLIAEGVETEEERVTLRSLDIDFGQGYHFGRPAPAEAWEQPPAPISIDRPVMSRRRRGDGLLTLSARSAG